MDNKESTQDSKLRLKALMLNGEIIGNLNEDGMEMYVEKLEELKEELASVDGENND